MPYDTLNELPDSVKKLPKHGQEIYQKAFNAAWEQYKDRGDQREALSHATAWSAVEKSYEKKDGEWVAITKESTMASKLSDENKRQLLQQDLTTEYGLDVDNTIPRGVWIEEVFENEVIYNVNGQS
ncbi:MAG: ChaB family protein, partial [Desulfobacteraceae bacterium]|nr:ChaB family protein [Desulfobacteraceae bacterium]